MMSPTVSVVIPAFNSAATLSETIESVLRQSLTSLEIIVVDDGSRDETEKIARRFRYPVKYFRLPANSGGPAAPRNAGVRAAAGRYIALFDADDVMLAGKLEEEAHFLDRNPGIPLVFSNFENFSGGRRGYDFLRDHGPFHRMPKILLGGPVPAAAWGDRNSEFRGNGAGAWYRIRSDDAYETLIPDTFIGTSSVMFRKHLAEDVGYFDETLCNSDDVDFFFRVARAHDIGYIDKILHRRRLHGGNISSRPAALRARLRVYERQKSAPLSPKARRDLDRFLASVLFSIGYAEKLAGHRSQAVHYYLESLRRRRANPAAGLAILKALVS